MSNGCGCESGWLKYVPVPYAKRFYAACCVHDDDYDRGGNKAVRKEADRNLFSNCVRIVSRADKAPCIKVWMVIVAWLYYLCVRLFGYKYFNYK